MNSKEKKILITVISIFVALLLTIGIVTAIFVVKENKRISGKDDKKKVESVKDETSKADDSSKEDSDEEDLDENVSDNDSDKEDEEEDEEEKPVVVQYNTMDKLNAAYANNEIDINKYFQQLLYVAYNSDLVDEAYASDYDCYLTPEMVNVENFCLENWDKLDEELRQYFLNNYFMTNVTLGSDEDAGAEIVPSPAPGSEVTDNPSATPMTYSNFTSKGEFVQVDKAEITEHVLDKVHLSKNENFLIWYTSEGEDGITDERLQEIDDTLEDALAKFEEEFGVDYKSDIYLMGNFASEDRDRIQKALRKNDISEDYLDNTMIVYVFDTGSDSTLATYYSIDALNKYQKFADTVLDVNDGTGIVSYPFIKVNTEGIDTTINTQQVMAHELFHHFQLLYRDSKGNRDYDTTLLIGEATANYAASVFTDATQTDTFLNGWATRYTACIGKDIESIRGEGGGLETQGYALFPYIEYYVKNVENGKVNILDACLEDEPYEFLHDKATAEELNKVVNDLALDLLKQDFEDKSFMSAVEVTPEKVLDGNSKISEDAAIGGIKYYELDKYTDVSVTCEYSDYSTIMLFGKKESNWTLIDFQNITMDIKTASYFEEYEKLYVAVANGSLKDAFSITITMKAQVQENSEFVTSIDNYTMEMEMKLAVSGIETSTTTIGTIDEKHQKQYLEATYSAMGMSLGTTKMYVDFDSGYTYMTQLYQGDTWYKQKGASSVFDMQQILEQLISMNNVVDNGNGNYTVTVTADDYKGLMNGSDVDTSMLTGSMKAEVQTSNGYITQIDYDFSDMIKGFDYFKATVKFSNYNEAGDVELPTEIYEEAVDM